MWIAQEDKAYPLKVYCNTLVHACIIGPLQDLVFVFDLMCTLFNKITPSLFSPDVLVFNSYKNVAAFTLYAI